MFPTPQFLVLLIVATPAILVFDGPIIYGLTAATTALSVAIIALRIRSGEAGFLLSVVFPLAVIALVPAFWMVLQVLPVKAVGLANPIWESAAAALGHSLAGSISIDPGATLIALARYLSAAGIAFVAVAVAIDRYRCEWILFALITATTLISALVLADGHSDFIILRHNAANSVHNAAIDCGGIGVNLALAAAFHAFERSRTQGAQWRRSEFRFAVILLACLAAFTTCSLAVILVATSQAYFAVICGTATLFAAMIIRRFRLGPWGYSAIVSVALVVAIAAISLQPATRTAGLPLAFATHAPAPLITLTRRLIMEAGWAGTGAGTFSAVIPIYRGIDELMVGSFSPTATAAIAVEMGRPFLWASLIAVIVLVVMLLRGAVHRGRDSYYSTAGASCVVTVALQGFGNAGLFSTSVLIITAAIIGMAVAQSKSRFQ